MPLTAGNVRQTATGSAASAASVTVGFAAPAAAGSVVLLRVGVGLGLTTPTGFTMAARREASESTNVNVGPQAAAYYLVDAVGGSQSWTVNQASATATGWVWQLDELTGIDLVNPLESQGTTCTIGVDDTSGVAGFEIPGLNASQVDRVDLVIFAVAMYAAPADLSSTDFHQWAEAGAGTDDLSEENQLFTSGGSPDDVMAAFARRFEYPATDTGLPNVSVARASNHGAFAVGHRAAAVMCAFAAEGSPVRDPIVVADGAEHGTIGGVAAGAAGSRLWETSLGTWNTNLLVQNAGARSGTYCYRIVQAGAGAHLQQTTANLGTGLTQAVIGIGVKAVSATTNPAIVWEAAPAVGDGPQLVYNVTTAKFGVRWGFGGAVSYQSGTTALGTWAWVDLRATFGATRVIDWRIEQGGAIPTTQTSPANLTAQTASTWATFNIGSGVAQTCTFDYDDICLSNANIDYPLGRHKVVIVVPDTTATPTAAGTIGNWSLITNNVVGAALAAGNIATVPGLLDEVPPTTSASSDGVALVTANAANIITLPMGTYTAAATDRIDACRAVVAMWANAAATAIMRWDWQTTGAQATFWGVTAFQPSNATAYSATVPYWIVENLPDASGWSQTKLNALVFKFGFSTDATPDIGPVAVYAMVAVFTDFIPAPGQARTSKWPTSNAVAVRAGFW